MISYLWQITAPGLATSLAICGSGGLVAFAMTRVRPLRAAVVSPVQCFTLSSVLVLALLLNGNALVPGRWLFPLFLLAGAVGLAMALRRGRHDPLAHAVIWTSMAAWLCSILLVAAWDLAFAGRHLWMLEGTNHDLVFFYGGAKWATQHALAVDQATVQGAWGLGRCGQGMQFIGAGCTVNRNGSYTLLALASSFLESASPNRVRAMVGSFALFPLLGVLPTMAGRFGRDGWWPRGGMLTIVLSLLCMGCAGMLLAVVNENVGTALAASLLVMVVFWALTPMPCPRIRWVMLGIAAACVGIIYGEAAVHACAIIAVSVIADARAKRSWRCLFTGGALSFAAFAVILNRQAPELLSSYTQVSELVVQSDWPSWYIHHQPWWWLGAPFAGLLMTANPPVQVESVLMGVLLMGATACLAVKEGRWRFYCGLLLFSASLVCYIQVSGYQYGEHKLLQVLGPAWVALLAWLLARHARRRRAMAVVLCLVGILAVISLAFAQRARSIIHSHMPSALTTALGEALKLPKQGDEVVIDAVSVTGAEKYIKQDFAILELHQRGARTRLPVSARRPEGYSDAIVEGSLAGAATPDWLLVLRKVGSEPVTSPTMSPVAEDATFALYDLAQGTIPVVVAGKGWHPCEQDHCWTSGEFTLEAVVPAGCEGAELDLELSPYHAPAGSSMAIAVGSVTRGAQRIDGGREISIGLPRGQSTVTLRPDWTIQSPRMLGESADERALAASVAAASIQCRLIEKPRP